MKMKLSGFALIFGVFLFNSLSFAQERVLFVLIGGFLSCAEKSGTSNGATPDNTDLLVHFRPFQKVLEESKGVQVSYLATCYTYEWGRKEQLTNKSLAHMIFGALDDQGEHTSFTVGNIT